MKKKLYFLFVLWIVCIFFPVGDLLAQTQIGSDIDGQAANDRAGSSVSLSSDGSVVAIGAPGHDGNKGKVQVYQNMSGTWTQIGSDIDGQAANDQAGYSVSLSSDGSVVAIGAPGHDGFKGTVQVYQNMSGTWNPIGNDIDGQAAFDGAGTSVSLSSDGSVVAIGAPGHDGRKGTVQVYQNMSGIWTQIGIDIDGQAAFDQAGFSVSLSSDGSVVAIGALGHDGFKGTVQVYKNMSGIWSQIGNDIDGQAANDQAGFSVSLSSDGSVVAIGALGHDGDKGTVQVYKNMSGTWTQIGSDIDGQAASDQAGWSVSLSSDGSVVAIGAPGHDGFKGRVQVYENMSGTWTQIGSDIDGQAANNFAGSSVSLSSDGSVVAIGAPGHDGKGTVQVLYNPAPQQAPIPTMSQWGLLIFGLLIINMSVVFVQRKELN